MTSTLILYNSVWFATNLKWCWDTNEIKFLWFHTLSYNNIKQQEIWADAHETRESLAVPVQ